MLFRYPNRPVLVPPDPKNPFAPESRYIDSLEAEGRWVGELKWNGDNTTLHTDDWSLWNRRGQPLHYHPTPEVLDELRRIFPPGCSINLETVDRHTKGVKDLLVVHCTMVWKGARVGTWGESRTRLEDLRWDGRHVMLSETFRSGFWERFQEADGKTVEGIILKDPKGVLVHSTTPIKDVPWMRKIRKPCAKYKY